MATDSLQTDISLCTNLIMGAIFNGDGIQQLFSAVQQAGKPDPAALASLLFINFQHAREAIVKNQLPIDSKAWSSSGGAIDQIIKQVCELLASKFGQTFISPQFMVATKGYLLQALKQQDTQGAAPQGDQASQGMPPSDPSQESQQGAPQGLIAPPDQQQQGDMPQ